MSEATVKTRLNGGYCIRALKQFEADAMLLAQLPAGQAGTEFRFAFIKLQLPFGLDQEAAPVSETCRASASCASFIKAACADIDAL